MAHPQIPASGTATTTGSASTATINYPTSTINSGDLLICMLACDGARTVSNWDVTDDWTETTSQANSSAVSLSIAWRKADGNEGSTFDVTLSASDAFAAVVFHITGADDPTVKPPSDTATTGDSSTPDPPEHDLTPTGASTDDYLWIACCAVDRRTVSAYPYADNNTAAQSTGSQGVTSAACTDELTGPTQNPGTFTAASSDQWVAATIAVYPGADTTDELTASNITSGTPVLGTPSIGQTHVLSINDVDSSSPVVDAPSIGQTHVLSISDFTSGTPIVDAPTLSESGTDELTAANITSGIPVVDAPSIGQEHVLSINNINAQNAVVESPSIGQTHVLSINDVDTQNAVVGLPAIGQTHVLSVGDIDTANTFVDSPSIGQIHGLSINNIDALNAFVENSSIGQIHGLQVNDIDAGNPLIEAPVIAEASSGGGVRARTRIAMEEIPIIIPPQFG